MIRRLRTKLRKTRNALRYRQPGIAFARSLWFALFSRTPGSLGCRSFRAWAEERISEEALGGRSRLVFRGGDIVLGSPLLEPNEGPVAREAAMGCLVHVLYECLYCPVYFDPRCQPLPDETAVDLGAANGAATLQLARAVGPSGAVHAFEPVASCVDALRYNTRANNLSNVTIHPVAVSSASGRASICCAGSKFESSHLIGSDTASRDGGEVVTVETVSLDEACNFPVHFIKMDIEGAEEFALNGAKGVLMAHRPKLSIASYHQSPNGGPQHPRIRRMLREMGYQVLELGEWHIYAFCKG